MQAELRLVALFTAGLSAFRRQYPQGKNLVVARDVKRSFTRNYGELSVAFVGLAELIVEVLRATKQRTG